MTPEQREELKQAAQAIIDVDASNDAISAKAYLAVSEAFSYRATPSAILSLIAQVEALTVPVKVRHDQCSEAQRNAVYMALHYYMNVQTPDEWKATDEAIAAFLAAAPTIPTMPGTKEGA